MPVQKTEAIVIRSQSLGELDKIITFFTLSFGKVRAVARRVKRPKSPFGGSLELLNYGDLVFFERPNKDLQIINSFDVSEPFNALKDDLTKTAYSSYIAELIDVTEAEGKANETVFQLTLKTLSVMKEITDVELLVHAFELQLLALTGFKPQLYRCVACGGELDEKQLRFSPPLGGMLCKDCFYRDASAISISAGTGKLMRKLQTVDLPLILRFGATRPVKRELNSVLSAFITFQLEKQFKSLDFIASLTVNPLK